MISAIIPGHGEDRRRSLRAARTNGSLARCERSIARARIDHLARTRTTDRSKPSGFRGAVEPSGRAVPVPAPEPELRVLSQGQQGGCHDGSNRFR
jgi:hypothetical protein